jgi:subtilisin family serine protease
MKFQIALVLVGLACSALAAPATIEPQILKNLEKASTTNVLVTFRKSNTEAALARFDSLALSSRNAKLNSLYAILKDHADTVQSDVMAMLEKTRSTKNHDVRQLWISAELIVRDADKQTIEALSSHPDVESLVAEKFFPLEPVEFKELSPSEITPFAQWGVDAIRAENLWNQGNRGQGAVVANIDTGVRYTHIALNSNYRGTVTGSNDYAWYAPTGKTAAPSDGNGHGTHTMGTIAGTANGIGVAPGATWIACRGCSTSSCSSFDLSECGNWVACPTTTSGGSPDCTKAPNVSSNSWGGGQGDSWYDNIIAAWRRVNIAPLFSAGNSGPTCGSANSPSDRSGAIAIGSTTSTEELSSFSSVGPTVDGRMKPDVSAPGSAVISASSSSDTGYATMSGTSMACPHAAGLSALLFNTRPNLTVDQLKTALISGAQRINSSGRTCSGVPDTTYPNHHSGAGRIDAVASNQFVLDNYS